MPGTLTGTRTEQGRPVIAGSVDLYFRTASRILVLRLPGEPDRLFMLNLGRNPSASPEFGPWQRVDYVDDHPPAPPRKGGERRRLPDQIPGRAGRLTGGIAR